MIAKPRISAPNRVRIRIGVSLVLALTLSIVGIATPGTQAVAPTSAELAATTSVRLQPVSAPTPVLRSAPSPVLQSTLPHVSLPAPKRMSQSAQVQALPPALSQTAIPAVKADPLAGWSLEQKVGQLFMVGVPVTGNRDVSLKVVKTKHVGNIFLHGRTTAGVKPVRKIVSSYTKLVAKKTTRNTAMFVASDQEGGRVQVLRGPGFSNIPSAMTQSKWSKKKLRKQSRKWGKQMSAAGVNLNLAPVMDVVTNSSTARTNGPIGVFQRNFGYGPKSTWTHANAFSKGMRKSGVDVAIKHFPGLGRVRSNTDTSAAVVDAVTSTRKKDPQMRSFRKGIKAGAPFVMMSSAIYTKIDKQNPAAFSRKTVTKVLRKNLGFNGVVISDDLAAAKAVQKWKPSTRAVKFIKAGGDMVLVSADASVAAEMIDAVIARAKKSPSFAAKVDAAVLRVLEAKTRL